MMAAAKELVTVVECLNTVGSGTWVAPDETDSIDYCVIAGGGNGTYGKINSSGAFGTSGSGGTGGQVINFLSLDTSSTKSFNCVIGGIGTVSSFAATTAEKNYNAGGVSVGTSYENYTVNGQNGSAGSYMFNNDYNNGYFGTSGGSGAAVFAYKDDGTTFSATGGSPRGGSCSGSSLRDASTGSKAVLSGTASKGSDATTYGDGGGGGAVVTNSYYDKIQGNGGSGKQGAIFIRYSRYKKSSDVISTVNGHKIVKINW